MTESEIEEGLQNLKEIAKALSHLAESAVSSKLAGYSYDEPANLVDVVARTGDDMSRGLNNVANAIREVFGSEEVGDALSAVAGYSSPTWPESEELTDLLSSVARIVARFETEIEKETGK